MFKLDSHYRLIGTKSSAEFWRGPNTHFLASAPICCNVVVAFINCEIFIFWAENNQILGSFGCIFDNKKIKIFEICSLKTRKTYKHIVFNDFIFPNLKKKACNYFVESFILIVFFEHER